MTIEIRGYCATMNACDNFSPICEDGTNYSPLYDRFYVDYRSRLCYFSLMPPDKIAKYIFDFLQSVGHQNMKIAAFLVIARHTTWSTFRSEDKIGPPNTFRR
jgi:hypothetical protein